MDAQLRLPSGSNAQLPEESGLHHAGDSFAGLLDFLDSVRADLGDAALQRDRGEEARHADREQRDLAERLQREEIDRYHRAEYNRGRESARAAHRASRTQREREHELDQLARSRQEQGWISQGYGSVGDPMAE
jgi:hypothetical protein